MIKQYSIQGLSLLFFSFYLLGILFPDLWWSTHFLAFLSPGLKYSLLAISGLLIIYSIFGKANIAFSRQSKEVWDQHGGWIIVGISLGTALLIYHFSMTFDYYGDAYKITQHLDQTVSNIPKGADEALFSFSLSPWEGHVSTLAMVTYIAYFTGLTYGEAFLWMDLICGSLFVWVWLSFIRYYVSNISWQLIMGVAGITAPFMLIFFGHIESYAPVFLSFLSWQLLLLIYIQQKHRWQLWALLYSLIICLKFHPVALLFIPALAILFLQEFLPKSKWTSRLHNWEGIARWLLLPIFAAGAILYFFVFGDHQDSRDLGTKVMEFDRLFLPLFSPDPPLDTYNMLSFNHLFDYFSEMLIWSPIAFFLILAILIHKSEAISWHSLPIRTIGLSLILFGSLFFVINPLLSMQMDWDLMAIPASSFLVFTLLLVKEIEPGKLDTHLLPTSMAIAILSISIFFVHANPKAHSYRLESLGIRVYHSYYEWANEIIKKALDHVESREAYVERKQKVLDKLKPYASPEIDFEYARLLIEEGRYYLRIERDYQKALAYLDQAYTYYPIERNCLLYLMETHFMLKDYEAAYRYSEQLLAAKYPSTKKAMATSIHCALEAQLYDKAFELATHYRNNWKDNQTIEEVYQRLNQRDRIDSLKFLFARPN